MEALNTQSLDALERASSNSARDDQHEKEADAAAGSSRTCDGDEPRPQSKDLSLPLEARGKSHIGCAQRANLELALADTSQLQSQANAALERMARQRLALKRIPVACPSCGTLNVPKGAAWAGDLVPCQECSQPFLPLSNSFQEADLLVLKTAVKRLRDQAEQIQYLECLLKKGRTGHSASPRRLSPMAPQEPWSPPRTAVQSPADRLDGRSFLSPSSQTRNVGELTPSTPESGHLEGPAPLKSFASRLPVAGELPHRPPVPPVSGTKPEVPNRDDRAPPLMSFLDTQDLLTNSSSSSAPMFHGSKLACQLDTEQKTREVLQRLREDIPKGRRKREREEGEIVSASESEAGSRWPSQEMRFGSGASWSEESKPRRGTEPAREEKDWTSAVEKWYLLKISACLGIICLLRSLLRRMMRSHAEVATSILAAALTGAGLTLWCWAEQTVLQQNQFETSKIWKHGLVCIHCRLLGRDIDLTAEEALGIACLLAEIAPVFFFENWGLYGRVRQRWVAVVAHVASSLAISILVRRKMSLVQGCKSSMQVPEAWVGLAAGNWVASTWAALTWWPVAADQVSLPVLALASVQLINFWLAQGSAQPHLLAACVALGGLSMAGVCCTGQHGLADVSSTAGTSSLLAPAFAFVLFCAASALLLFQELFMSL